MKGGLEYSPAAAATVELARRRSVPFGGECESGMHAGTLRLCRTLGPHAPRSSQFLVTIRYRRLTFRDRALIFRD
jgi:hypothetical protein